MSYTLAFGIGPRRQAERSTAGRTKIRMRTRTMPLMLAVLSLFLGAESSHAKLEFGFGQLLDDRFSCRAAGLDPSPAPRRNVDVRRTVARAHAHRLLHRAAAYGLVRPSTCQEPHNGSCDSMNSFAFSREANGPIGNGRGVEPSGSKSTSPTMMNDVGSATIAPPDFTEPRALELTLHPRNEVDPAEERSAE